MSCPAFLRRLPGRSLRPASSGPFTAWPALSRRQALLAAVVASSVLAPAARAAEAWPSQPVRLVVPFAAGGGADIVARALGQQLAGQLGRPVVVENVPGGATVIGALAVVRATDGHTLLLSGSSTYSVNPALRPKLPYQPGTDLVAVGLVARAPLVLLVPAASPARSLDELLAQARARPGALNYATFGAGSAPHLAGSLLALAGGVSLQDIPYKGSAPALNGLMSGELQLGIDTVAAAGPLVKAGKLRALAVLSERRSATLPEVPSVRELKLPEAAFDAWYALAAPARFPAAAQARMGTALRAALAAPALQEQLRAQALDPAYADAADTRVRIESEIARYRALAHRAHIVVD